MRQDKVKIAVIGLGLIGGSIAKAFKKYTNYEISGFDRDESTLKKALSDGSIDRVCEEFLDEDIVILGLFPQTAIDFVRENAKKFGKNTIVADCGGVKTRVCREIQELASDNGFTFIGMHPMAGRELFGYNYSTADLFKNASLIITPDPKCEESLVKKLVDVMMKIGFSRLQRATPEEHDRVIAYTSQLAHIVSGAYIKSPTAMCHAGFSAGSFRDMTRVAHLNEHMWTELFSENYENLANEIDSLTKRLTEYSDALKSRDEKQLFLLLKDGREKKDLSDKLCGKE